MSKIDLTFDCEEVYIVGKGSSFKDKVTVRVENADKFDFDNENIAKCVSVSTFVNANGVDDVIDYLADYHLAELVEYVNKITEG